MAESIRWQNNTALLMWKRKLNGSDKTGCRQLDLDRFGIARNGLLDDAVSEMLYPLQHNIVGGLFQMLEQNKGNKFLVRILSTKTSTLMPCEIQELYSIIETSIEGVSTISEEGRWDTSSKFRAILLQCSKTLSNGERVRDVTFTSKFWSHTSAKGIMSARKKKAEKSIFSEERLKCVDHEDTESLRKNFLDVAEADLQSIKDVCIKAIDTYKSVKDEHIDLLNKYRNNQPPKTLLWAKDPKVALGFKLAELERRRCFTIEGFRAVMAQNPKYVANTALGLDHGMKYIENPFNPIWKNVITYKEYYFCSKFMPRLVIEAAQCLITIHTGWNVDPVAGLTVDHITSRSGYYIINGVKSKTNAAENVRVFKNNHPYIYDLLTLMLEHSENVDKCWSRTENNIWVTWSDADDFSFRMMGDGFEKVYIAKPAELPLFNKKQLRDRAIMVMYLKNPNPFEIKEKLGHVDINTTLIYLNQLVLKLLNKSHVKRFMDRLAATVVWSVGGNNEVERRGMSLERVDEKLLFPVKAYDKNEHCICDQWIDSIGDLGISIGRKEIEHLKFQINHYSTYGTKLKQNNPKHFLLYDVPRILFATALSELVRTSAYANMLEEC